MFISPYMFIAFKNTLMKDIITFDLFGGELYSSPLTILGLMKKKP